VIGTRVLVFIGTLENVALVAGITRGLENLMFAK